LPFARIRDQDVRVGLRARLSALFSHDPGTLIIEELGVMNGESRIDFAVVNGEFHGYEIKSEMDTLDRLPTQSRLYSMVFEVLIHRGPLDAFMGSEMIAVRLLVSGDGCFVAA
jgi:hypothetical protein